MTIFDSVSLSPARSPIEVPSVLTILSVIVTTSSSLPLSTARRAVIIFVVLAIGLFVCASLSKITSLVSAIITTAEDAESAYEKKLI